MSPPVPLLPLAAAAETTELNGLIWELGGLGSKKQQIRSKEEGEVEPGRNEKECLCLNWERSVGEEEDGGDSL